MKPKRKRQNYPKEIEYVTDLPKTESGKIQRKKLRSKHINAEGKTE